MKKKRILIIDNNQFGYLTDTYKYCEYLKDKYDIIYLCYDKGFRKLVVDGVKVIYIGRFGNKLIRGCYFFLKSILTCVFTKGFIFVVYFQGFEYLKKLMPWKKLHIDVRTMSVHPNESNRKKKDDGIRRAARWFDSVSYISNGVYECLHLKDNAHHYLLPLGADVISDTNKTFEQIRLLYVGTLNNREIIKTVKGLKLFMFNHPQEIISYDIVGDGKEYGEISNYIKEEQLDNVKLHGRIDYQHLKPFFDKCNIGVSFVPITPYYENQPPTKTFEYAFSGLFTIATATSANKEIVRDDNGLLITDDVSAFVHGLEKICKIKDNLQSEKIRESVLQYSWENIINHYFVELVEKEYPN